MKYNIFIVTGPLHIMNAIEAIDYFKTKNNILLVLYTAQNQQLEQMKKILKFHHWHTIKYIPLPMKTLDKLIFTYEINNSLKDIDSSKLDKIFVGDYRSDHVNHIVNFFQNKNIYLLDDGLAQVIYHKETSNESFKVKTRRFIYKLLMYKLSKIKYTFFTIFDIENEKVIKNRYSFFKKYIKDKKVENAVYFIGQPLIEANIISEDIYKNELSKVINFYDNKKFVYILHRREDENRVKKLSIELNFKYKIFENLIELEMINSKSIPSEFATFFSTAIVTLPNFITLSEYRVFQIDNRYINQLYINDIVGSYKEFERLGLKKEVL